MPDDVEDLALAMHRAAGRDRTRVRAAAVERCSISVMIDLYEDLYRRTTLRSAA